jgi:hypothetical protein
MTNLTNNWNTVKNLLQSAYDDLSPARSAVAISDHGPTLLTGTAEEVVEFLQNNELELAWDALAEMGIHTKAAGPNFWLQLSMAAREMGRLDKAAETLERSQQITLGEVALLRSENTSLRNKVEELETIISALQNEGNK